MKTDSIFTVSDAFAENVMKAMGLRWEVKDIPMSKILIDEGRKNRARLLAPLNEETGNAYAHDMMRGDKFPMAVLVEFGSGYLPAGGNHRIYAANKLGLVNIRAYVVKTSDKTILDILPRTLNRAHGIRTNQSELLEHAACAVSDHGFTPKDAAELFSVPIGSLTAKIRQLKHKLRIEATQIPNARFIPLTTADKIGQIKNEKAHRRAVEIFSKHRHAISNETRDQIISDIRDAKTEAMQLAAADSWQLKLENAAKPTLNFVRKTTPARARLLATLNTVQKLLEGKKKWTELGFGNNNEIQDVKKQISRIQTTARSLA